MLTSCILDLVTNLFVNYMVFVSDIQKLSIPSHIEGLDTSFLTAVSVQLSHAYRRWIK